MTALDIPGWMSPAELQWLESTASRMSSVAELGCYLGRSTFALCSGCKGTVYAIDNWTTVTAEIKSDDETFAQFKRNMGGFFNLVIWRGHIKDFPNEWPVDMVFIDAAHDYASVLADIRAWTPKARKLICGHDADLPEVWRAVKECFPPEDIVIAVGSIWAVEL